MMAVMRPLKHKLHNISKLNNGKNSNHILNNTEHKDADKNHSMQEKL